MRLQERLLGLARERLHEATAREARAHQEQVHLAAHAGEHHLGLAPVDLRLRRRLVAERHERLVDELAQLAPALAHVAAHLALGRLDAVLVTQPLPHPPRGVALLARRLAIARKPVVDQRPVGPQLRRRAVFRALARRRQRRLERLAHRPPVHTVAARQLVDRDALPITVPADLLEQLHSRSHPFRGSPSTLDRAPKVRPRSDGGGAKSGVRTGTKSGVRAQRANADRACRHRAGAGRAYRRT